MRICGLCKRAPREDDGMAAMRLRPEDIAASGEDLEEGCYHACAECVATFSPIIKDRLVKDGVIRPDTSLTPQFLL
jgi:hypothetical protein